MANVTVHDESLTFDDPILIEGLPGLGLVGKIAADHLVEQFDLAHYASCHCQGLPDVAIYDADSTNVQPPVRLHGDPERDLLVLQSDVPVSPSAAAEFAGCVTGWLAEHDVTPVYVSGTQREDEARTDVFGVATGEAGGHLTDLELPAPDERGVVSGPTGALLYEAERSGLDSLGVVVEASPQFPDPAASKVLLERVVEPLAGVDVDTETLVEQAEEISAAREELARQMQQADDESSRAQRLGMFH